MVLSAQEKNALKERYDILGLDAVRKDMEEHEYKKFVPTDEAAFARSWIAAEEAKRDRAIQTFKFLAVIFFSLFGGTIAWFLIE